MMITQYCVKMRECGFYKTQSSPLFSCTSQEPYEIDHDHNLYIIAKELGEMPTQNYVIEQKTRPHRCSDVSEVEHTL